MNIPKEYASDHRFRYIYSEKGKCPKCNHWTYRAKQSGAMPPRITCPVCHWSDWEMKGFRVNYDVLPGR